MSPSMPAVQDVSAAHAFDTVVGSIGDGIVIPIPRTQVRVGTFGMIFRSGAVETPAPTRTPLRTGLLRHRKTQMNGALVRQKAFFKA